MKVCWLSHGWLVVGAVAGTRKLEIFARQHNVRPGWVSLGNQLNNTNIREPDMLARYVERYGPPLPPN